MKIILLLLVCLPLAAQTIPTPLPGEPIRIGSGGGTGTASITRTVVAFSATPTYTCATHIQEWEMTLTGNVTAPNPLSGCVAGDILTMRAIQDATGNRTFAWPTGFSSACTISPTASVETKQIFYWDGTNAIPLSTCTSTDAAIPAHAAVVAQAGGMLGGLTPAAAGTVFTSNGASADPTWQAAAGGSPTTCDPFIVGNDCRLIYPAANLVGGPNGVAGLQMYPFIASGGTAPIAAPTATFPAGSMQLTTNTTSSGMASVIYTNSGSVGGAATFADPIENTGTWKWVSIGKCSATTNEQIFMGLTSNVGPPGCPSNVSGGSGTSTCIGIEFDTGQSDTNFMCVYKAQNLAGSRLSTGVAIDTALHTFTVEKVDGTHMKCSVDATTVTLTIANPDVSQIGVFPVVQIITTNTTSKTFNVGAIIRYFRTGLSTF